MVKLTVRKCFLSCRKNTAVNFSSEKRLLNPALSCGPRLSSRELGESDPVEGPP